MGRFKDARIVQGFASERFEYIDNLGILTRERTDGLAEGRLYASRPAGTYIERMTTSRSVRSTSYLVETFPWWKFSLLQLFPLPLSLTIKFPY
jgi:hypothetical protein